jgi:hypothetical protein
MSADDLVDRLVADLAPARRGAVGRRLLIGLVGGTLVAALLMVAWLGVRPDTGAAIHTAPYWIKFGYTLALSLFGLIAVARLARPGGNARFAFVAALAALALMAVLAAVEMIVAPADTRPHLLFGASATVCPWFIIALALPVFLGMLWMMRGLAPTRLTLAGAAAGLAAGSVGAWVYAFHCDESAATFVTVWYTLGVGVVTLIGALLGRYVLRW